MVMKRYGTRLTMFSGGLIAAVGLLISSFATNIYTIIMSFGVMTGINALSITRMIKPHVRR